MLTSAVVRAGPVEYFHLVTAAMAASPSTGLPPSSSAFSTLPLGAMVTRRRTVPPMERFCSASGYSGSTRVSSFLSGSLMEPPTRQNFHARSAGAEAYVSDGAFGLGDVQHDVFIRSQGFGHGASSGDHQGAIVGLQFAVALVKVLPQKNFVGGATLLENRLHADSPQAAFFRQEYAPEFAGRDRIRGEAGVGDDFHIAGPTALRLAAKTAKAASAIRSGRPL